MAILWLYLMATSSARDVGTRVGDDPCDEKDCPICRVFTPEQIQHLATPTYRDRNNKDKKTVSASPTPTLMDPSQVSVLGRVEGEKAVKKSETTPVGKKKRSDESPKASKRKPSSRPSTVTEDLKSLDDKWAECFARLEAMLLAKSFAVPVEPVVKPAEVITSEKPFFDPGAGTSQKSTGVSDVIVTSPSPFQVTGEVPVKATQPVEAPGAASDILLTSTGNAALHVDQTLTGGKTVESAGGSDSDEDLESEPDRDLTRDESADQELPEEASQRETIRGVRSFMGWHQIPEFNSAPSSDDNPFAGSRVQPTGKVSVKMLVMDDWLCRKMEKLTLPLLKATPPEIQKLQDF